MPYSKNEALIRELQQEIKENLGKVSFKSNYSAAFFKVFKENLDIKEIENIILTTKLTTAKLAEFDFILKDFTKTKFKSFLKNIKYSQTKNAFIKYFSKYFNLLDAKDMTEALANSILKKEGESALLQIYPLFGKKRATRKYSYTLGRYTLDSSLTTNIKKMKLSKPIMEALLAKNDLPKPFKSFLNKKLNKKVMTAKEHAKWLRILEIYLADCDSGTANSIKVEDLKKFVAKISTQKK